MPYLIFRIHPTYGVPRFLMWNSEMMYAFLMKQVTIIIIACNWPKSMPTPKFNGGLRRLDP